MTNTRKLRYHAGIYLKHDLPAGLTVFFVALPLCLGIALASGAPLYTGIVSGIIGGLVASLISDSQLVVSGPAAGLTTVVAFVLANYNFNIFMAVVAGAGLLQILMGLLRLGNIAGYFPSAVIKGMMAAIGIILISKQLPVALGYQQPDFWSKEFINLITDTHLFSNMREFYSQLSAGTLLITALSLAAYTFWEKPMFDKLRFIPVPLFVVATSISLTIIFRDYVPALALNPNEMVKLPEHIFSSFQLPDFSILKSDFTVVKYVFVFAMLASLETLLCIEAIDNIDPLHRTTSANRELLAQGTGNVLCGFMGGIPMTGVIVRGSANVEAGARTRWASFTHGVFMLIAVIGIPFIINKIPLCALASILIVTGYKLTKPKLYSHTFRLGWNQFLPFIITILVILFTDLLIGVSIGLLLSIFFIVRNNYIADYDVKKETHLGITTYTVKLHTNVTFLDKSKMKDVLENVPDYSKVIIDGSFTKHIDHDVLEMISGYRMNAKRRGIELELKNVELVEVTEMH